MTLPISGASQVVPSTLVDNHVYMIKNQLNKAIFPAGSLAAAQQLCCPPTLTRIVIKTLPTKTEYNVGDAMDWTGLSVTGIFSDGSTKEYEATSSEVTLDPAEGATFGEANDYSDGNVTVKVGSVSKTVKFTVRVEPFVHVDGIIAGNTGQKFSVEVGKDSSIYVAIYPNEATDKRYSVQSSDDTVFTATASIETWGSYVILHGVNPGSATLTVTSLDEGLTDEHEVTVTAAA